MKFFKTQRGIAQIPLLVVLLAGIIIGVILVQRQTNIVPQARECTQRPLCLDEDSPCDIPEPKGGWCSRSAKPSTGSCNLVKSTSPFGECGKESYNGITYVCGDGTKGRLGGSSWDKKPSCQSLANLKQEVAKRCTDHRSCKVPGETSLPVPTIVPNPTSPKLPLTCRDCPGGFSLCKNKTTEELSCVNTQEPREMSTNLTCNSCPRIGLPRPSASSDTDI